MSTTETEKFLLVIKDASLEQSSQLPTLLSNFARFMRAKSASFDECGVKLTLSVKDVDISLRYIWPGRFLMGSPETELGRYDNEVQHPVVLTRGYWLGEVPVVQALWEAVIGNNPSRFRSPDRPVEQVSWHECQAFCEKLAALVPGLIPRLPTEAEWEYACRACTTTATYNGDIIIVNTGICAVQLKDIAWYRDNSDEQTHPVGQKRVNLWGLYDMLGNVYEWCQDSIDEYESPYDTQEQCNPLSTTGTRRIHRGGSFDCSGSLLRSAYRESSKLDYHSDLIGFRLAFNEKL